MGLFFFFTQICIALLRTCFPAAPECILCVCVRLPGMCMPHLYLACRSLGAIVNTNFWVSMCAEINVPFDQRLCAGRASVCVRGPTPRGGGRGQRGWGSWAMPEVVSYQPLRWLANGLLGGLANRLAGSQRLLLPYLVAAVGGGWHRGRGRGRGGAVFTHRVAGSERPSAMEQTQIT